MTESSVLPAASARPRTPVHLWIVGVLALLWNAMGCFDYLATELRWEPYMGQFSEEQLAYFYGFPAWVVACWAIAVWGGLAGSVGLLLRRRWAVWMFGLSIVAMVLSSIYSWVMTDGAEIMGQVGIIFSIVIWVVAFLLFFYARAMAKKGVLV